MDPTQLSAEQLQYAAVVSSWWFALLRKAVVTWIAYEFSLWMSRRLDRRAGVPERAQASGRRHAFSQVLADIRDAANPGLGIYYGLRELGRCLFLAAVVCYA